MAKAALSQGNKHEPQNGTTAKRHCPKASLHNTQLPQGRTNSRRHCHKEALPLNGTTAKQPYHKATSSQGDSAPNRHYPFAVALEDDSTAQNRKMYKPFVLNRSTTLHFLCNTQMGPISLNVCPWQAFPAFCNVTHEFIVPFVSYKENEVL